MATTIEKAFYVRQPIEKVWDFLTSAEAMVSCLPNARILEVVDDRTYRGEIGMKIGPVGLTFEGIICFEEIDPEKYEVRITADGKARRMPGRIKFAMKGRLKEEGNGIVRVSAMQEVSLGGRLASLGRGGVVQATADHMFDRFTKKLLAHLNA